tara:strand:+ start:301 stop:597 length:297 start_codon:yes stop_codon:yes gene_type:complete
MIFNIALIVVIVCGVIVISRIVTGPSLYHRVVALNAFGTISVLLIAILGFVTNRMDFLDIALLYALLNFIATLGILKFFRYKMLDFNDDKKKEEELND